MSDNQQRWMCFEPHGPGVYWARRRDDAKIMGIVEVKTAPGARLQIRSVWYESRKKLTIADIEEMEFWPITMPPEERPAEQENEPEMSEICSTCEHFLETDEAQDGEPIGECFRFPPCLGSPNIDGVRDRPVVYAGSSCGEYKRDTP